MSRPGQGAGTATETDRCEFSLDGVTFADWVKLDDQNLKPSDDGKVHIKVRAASDATTCTVSLASYLAHGPTFATSGEQVFVDFDTVTVKKGATDSLDIAVPDAGTLPIVLRPIRRSNSRMRSAGNPFGNVGKARSRTTPAISQ